jgi:hypothetical protein
MMHMLQWFYTRVATVRFKCSRCFHDMLQALHMNVARVEQDVAMVLHIYCKR